MRKATIILTALALAVAIPIRGGRGVEPERKAKAKRADDKVSDLMRRKVEHSQKLLGAITLNEFGEVVRHGEALLRLSEQAEWQVIKTPRYVKFSDDFRRSVQNLVASAKKKNGEAAVLDYVHMTIACTRCHHYVRENMKVRLDRKGNWMPLVLGGPTLALVGGGDAGRDGDDIPSAKKLGSKAEAVEHARRVDVPLLRKADRVVIAEAKRGGKGRTVTLTRPPAIRELRQALRPKMSRDTRGMTAATLTFYRGDRLLRKVWVYWGGQWGFERPGWSYTTGNSPELWQAIQKHLRQAPA